MRKTDRQLKVNLCNRQITIRGVSGNDNTAVDLDPLPVSRARLTVVEPALFEWDVFEMAAPIQSPAKCEVRSVIRFLNAKVERPAEIQKQIVAVYGNVMISTCFFT
jgi:hypothetical protein